MRRASRRIWCSASRRIFAEPNARLLRFRRQLVGWFGALAVLLLGVLGELLRRVLRPIRRLSWRSPKSIDGQRAQLGTEFPRELAEWRARSMPCCARSSAAIVRYRDHPGTWPTA